MFGLPPSVLRNRTVRDAVVHIDERLDEQAMRPPEVGLADRRVVLESHEWSLQKFGSRRVLVLDTLTYVFDATRLDLQQSAMPSRTWPTARTGASPTTRDAP